MQWQNNTENHPSDEEHSPINSARYYEQASGAQQTFQQQAYYPPTAGYQSLPHQLPPIVALPPLSAAQLAAIFSYSFGWVTGLLFVLFGGRDRFLRFHALQSLIFFGAINILDVALMRVIFINWYEYEMRFIPFLCVLLLMALNGLGVIAWIVGMIQAARGAYFKLPIVGELIANRMHLQTGPHQ